MNMQFVFPSSAPVSPHSDYCFDVEIGVSELENVLRKAAEHSQRLICTLQVTFFLISKFC